MIYPYVSLLILAGHMGIHSIQTMSEVSVKAGDSISIPCLYDSQYINHVKYLCKGKRWFNCKFVAQTNKQNSRKYSISDDKIQKVFNVTVNNLTDEDTDYWCALEKTRSYVKKYFQLSVTTGVPSLYVDQQEIRAFVGGNVTVRCYNDDPVVAEWCKLRSSCVTDQTGSIDGTRVTIDSSVPNVFSVTMSKLRTDNSGWYLCVNGDFQMPVHITVHESPLTTSTTTSPNTARPSPATTQYSSLPTSAEPYTAHPTNSTTNTTTNSTINVTGGESLQEHNSSTKVTILTTTLVLLLLVVPFAFFGWRMMMRRNKSKPEGSNITGGSQIGSDPDEHYATVVHTQHAAAQQQQKNTPEDNVTYSTIVIKDSVRQMTEPADGSVIYSILHTKRE